MQATEERILQKVLREAQHQVPRIPACAVPACVQEQRWSKKGPQRKILRLTCGFRDTDASDGEADRAEREY